MSIGLKIVAIMVLAVAAIAYASAQAAPSRDQQAKYEDEASKSCNYDLDHDRFRGYGSMEECVSDRAHKLARNEAMKSEANRPGVAFHQPN